MVNFAYLWRSLNFMQFAYSYSISPLFHSFKVSWVWAGLSDGALASEIVVCVPDHSKDQIKQLFVITGLSLFEVPASTSPLFHRFIGLSCLTSAHLTELCCRETPDVCWPWKNQATELLHGRAWRVYLCEDAHKLGVRSWRKSPYLPKALSFGPHPKIAFFLLDITKLEDVFQECLWQDLTSCRHSDHRTKLELAQIKIPWNMHDVYVGFSVFDDSHYKLTPIEWQYFLS